jgi:DNA-binding MarR family transcriptional regulator
MNSDTRPTGTNAGNFRSPEPDGAEILAIAHGLEHWSNSLGRQYGPLSRPQRRILSSLNTETGLRVGDLGELSGLTTAGTTRMLDKLESLGYTSRSRSAANDQRQVYVILTATGEQALHESEEVLLDRVRSSLQALNVTERVALIYILERLNAGRKSEGAPL